MQDHEQNASPRDDVEVRFLETILELDQSPDPIQRCHARLLRNAGVPFFKQIAEEFVRAGSNADRVAVVSVAFVLFCSGLIVAMTAKVAPHAREGYAALLLEDIREAMKNSPAFDRKAGE